MLCRTVLSLLACDVVFNMDFRLSEPLRVSPIVDRAELTIYEFRVLTHVASVPASRGARTSYREIAQRTGLSAATVSRAIQTLLSTGLIKQNRRRTRVYPRSRCPERYPSGRLSRRPWCVRLAPQYRELLSGSCELETSGLSNVEHRIIFHVGCCALREGGCTCRLNFLRKHLRIHFDHLTLGVQTLISDGWLLRNESGALVPRFQYRAAIAAATAVGRLQRALFKLRTSRRRTARHQKHAQKSSAFRFSLIWEALGAAFRVPDTSAPGKSESGKPVGRRPPRLEN